MKACTKELIENWIEYQRSENPNLQWTVMEFDKLTNKEPVEAWNAIQVIFERTKGEPDVICMIAAGPLEDLLVQNGEVVINEIENYTNKNPQFKDCVRGVWMDKRDRVYVKIENIKNSG